MLKASRRSLGVSRMCLRAILGLYVLAAALMPLGHHDIACHLKSTTHCSTCVVGSSAESAPHAAALGACGLDDAGAALSGDVQRIDEHRVGSSSGRSPPVV